jgi:hypothetical protein
VPGVVISAVWLERRLNLQFESLYPATRRDFVGELVMATALSFVELWLSITLAILVPIVLWSTRLHDLLPTLVVEICASALMQLLVFGVMIVAALFRGLVLYANVLTILAVLVPMTDALDARTSVSLHGLIMIAVAEATIGIALTFAGITAWRRADLA